MSPNRAPPGWAVRAASLLLALVVAKIAIVILRIADGGGAGFRNAWLPIAFVYQDVWAVLALAAVDAGLTRASRRKRWADRAAWALYVAAVGYCAFNVAVARVLSTPLTRALIGTAGGALADSIRTYVTPVNVIALGAVGVVAWLAPRLFRRHLPTGARVGALVIAAICLALGPTAAARVECQGLHRNAIFTLVESSLAQVGGPGGKGTSGATSDLPSEGPALDLSHFRGAAAGRDVLWVILESTGARYLRPYGASLDPTPHLTALAREAIVFQSVYSAYPESIKGLFSMICAAAPAPHTKAERYAEKLLPSACIAEQLARAGHATGLFHSGRFAYLGMADVVEQRGFQELVDAGGVGGKFVSSFGTDDASTVKRLLSFVDSLPPEKRFFAVYMPIAGHHPYRSPGEGPRPFPQKTELDAYKNDLFAGDAAFGALLDGLRARGRYNRTLVVVVGDHGEAFQQHEGNVAHSLFIYEENLHVPFIVAIPGVTVKPLRAPQIGSLIDVAPTILELAGLPPPPSWQGRSLLAGRAGVARFFTDHAFLQVGLRQDRWKFIHEIGPDRARLYDLDRDPGERNNVAGAQPERVARYRDHLRAWVAQQRARTAAP